MSTAEEDQIRYENKQIENLIAQENDPEKRLFLLVLQQIKLSLMANTVLTKDVSAKLDTHIKIFTGHVTDTAKMINTGKGMWKVVAILGGVLQVIFIGVFGVVLQEFKTIHANANELHLSLAKVISKQEILAKFYEAQLINSTREDNKK